jgi:hypothetical protein
MTSQEFLRNEKNLAIQVLSARVRLICVSLVSAIFCWIWGKLHQLKQNVCCAFRKRSGLRFGDAALKLGLITEADIQLVLAQQFDYPYLLPGQGKSSARIGCCLSTIWCSSRSFSCST